MHTTTTNLKEYKERKKYERITKDIDDILKILSLSQKALNLYRYYIPVQELISVIETNKTLLELYRKNYENKLQKITE